MDGTLLKILILPIIIILFSVYFAITKNDFSNNFQTHTTSSFSNISSIKNFTGEKNSQVFSSQNFQTLPMINISINNQAVNLEVAKTFSQRQIGLMNRNLLPQNQGMLFVFEKPQKLGFWMKNTLIPLDIIFLDKNFNILNIENAYPQPGVEDKNLKNYISNGEGMYVIELNLGEAKSLGLKPGDKIKIDEKNL